MVAFGIVMLAAETYTVFSEHLRHYVYTCVLFLAREAVRKEGSYQMVQAGSSQRERGEFFLFGPDIESGAAFRGVSFENLEHLLSPQRLILRPEAGGFPPLVEAPRLIFDASKGPAPRDLEGGFSGYWLVSDRLRQAMTSVDPDAFAFVRCETRDLDGSEGPPHFLCDVIRELDALDEKTSILRIKVSEDYVRGKFYSLGGGASLVFKPEILKGAHVFLTPFNPSAFCDRKFKEALRTFGIPNDPLASGISFVDAVDI